MEISAMFLLSSLALFLCITGNLGAWKCHVCDSQDKPDCGDNPKFSPEKIAVVDCDQHCLANKDFKPLAASSNGSGASQPVPGTTPRICPAADKYRSCRKMKLSTTISTTNGGNSVDRIVRMCGYEGENSTKEYEYTSGASYKRELYNCYAEGCNAGTPVIWSFSITFGFLLVLLALQF